MNDVQINTNTNASQQPVQAEPTPTFGQRHPIIATTAGTAATVVLGAGICVGAGFLVALGSRLAAMALPTKYVISFRPSPAPSAESPVSAAPAS